MPRASALKIVTDQPFYTKELDFSDAAEGQAHSLHYAVSMPGGVRVGAAAHCIKNFSAPGEVVVDPFCAGGETLLEAALLGRIPRGSDVNPLALRIAAAKLHPVDITAVTLKLQQINLRVPIGSKIYSQYFSPFYEINTFREIFNLRKFLQSNFDPASRFMEMLA